MTTTDDTTITALGRAVIATDAARRAGWAKAYAAEERLDEALRESNMFRSDRDAFRQALGFCFGLFAEFSDMTTTGPHRHLRAAMEEYGGVDCVLDDTDVATGRRSARRIRDRDDSWQQELEIEKAARAAAKKSRQANGKNEWNNAKRSALVGLAAHYGFPSVSAMETVLESFQKATGRPSVDPAQVRANYVRRAKRDARRPG